MKNRILIFLTLIFLISVNFLIFEFVLAQQGEFPTIEIAHYEIKGNLLYLWLHVTDEVRIEDGREIETEITELTINWGDGKVEVDETCGCMRTIEGGLVKYLYKFEHTYDGDPEGYTITALAKDENGRSNTWTYPESAEPEPTEEESPPPEDKPPTIELVDGAIWGTPKVGEETSLKLTAIDSEGVSKGISTITVNWGYNNKETVLSCGGTETCTLNFSHIYEQGGEFWITAWATDLDGNESEHKQWIRIIQEKEDRVGISIEHSPTGVTGRAITIEVIAWHVNGINSISVKYDGESDVQTKSCSGTPGQCIQSFSKNYDTVGTFGGKAWAVSGSLKSYELPFSYNIVRSDGSNGGGGPGLIEITNPLEIESFDDLIAAIIDFLFIIVLISSVILLIIAGILLVISQGDPKKAETAKRIIFYTLIGFSVVTLGKIIVAFIREIF